MALADTLSCLPNPQKNAEIHLDERVDGIDTHIDYVNISIINFSTEKQAMLREETVKDAKLNSLKEIIYQGWPENIRDLPTDLRPYWSFRDELAVESGVMFKGRQILIPESMQQDILQQLHEGHQGIEKTRQLSRESVYWVNINKEIEQMCKTCDTCQQMNVAQVLEPLIPHTIPVKPWQYIASDLFEINNRQFLLTVDRFSKFPLVDEIHAPVTSQAITDKIEMYSSLFGRLDEIMTDNGSQYTGQSFQTFVKSWGIKHVTSSPRYAQSNGFIERHVRHVKSVLKKTIKEKENIKIALMNIRSTPVDTNLPSPA